MKFIILTLLLITEVKANCKDYYFSLDFGGRVGDGLQITDYLVKEKVPHVIFMVGYNLESEAAKQLCEKINNVPEYKKYIKVGNHTKSHKGFKPKDTRGYIGDEIMTNESLILSKCTSQNYTKVFRYPKGQSHPIAEEILKKNNYTSQYSQYSDDKFRTQMGVGWTSDTRDWIEEGAASLWAQEYYYNKHNKFMPVNESSGKVFKNYVLSKDENTPAKKAFMDGLMPEVFDKNKHEELDGWHGPSEDAIVERLLNDKGVNGKCVPLTHFGGFNTLGALKRVIPKLKSQGKEFKLLDDNLNYAVDNLKLIAQPELLDPVKNISAQKCQLTDSEGNYHIVKSGDTLYSISRKYGVSVQKIKEYNNLLTDEIDLEQKLRLTPNQVIHIVKEDETLYRIAKTYDVGVDQIKSWNKLTSNEIEIDQKLTIKR